MSMSEDRIKLLTRQFSKKLIRSRKQSGRTFSYVEGATVIQRLNEVFGHDWSFEIEDRIVDFNAKQIAILGKLIVPRCKLEEFENLNFSYETIEEAEEEGSEDPSKLLTLESPVLKTTRQEKREFLIVKEQWGGAPIQCFRGTDNIVDLGNDLKSATTDAIKKCATLLGIGLHLYHEDEVVRTFELLDSEALNLTEEERASVKSKANQSAPASASQLQAITKVLDKSGAEPSSLLKFLKIKSLSEIKKSDAGLIITGKHKFWHQKQG